MKRYIKSAVQDPVLEDWRVKSDIAQSLRTSSSTLERLTIGANERTLHQILANPNISETVIDAIFKRFEHIQELHKYYETVAKILENTDNASIIDYCINRAVDYRDNHLWDAGYIRAHAAKNPNIPVALLNSLVVDTVAEVRESVASNPNLPIEQLKSLLNDPEYAVKVNARRYYEARN